MSEAVSAVQGATASGFVDVVEAGLIGMVTIRGDLSDTDFAHAVGSVTHCGLPEKRGIASGANDQLLWMSTDELLLICAHDEAEARVGALTAALSGQHHLAVNVSDARAVFRVTGTGSSVREALAKVTPAEMRPGSLPVGEVRRTRMAQVPAAIWFDSEDQATIVCFRSVGTYIFDLLAQSSKPGSEVGHF
ncbi:MAG: sarcosine oxidase subunit gamma [Boseongicola sp.]|nr:sarcosine oxidase subunit gamma [Boseongicola sp.]NNJ68646.1 sarcosine oxidase subunit gamma [Boseongicola sp.]